MRRDDARSLADQLLRAMSPYCERVEVAGSIRRGKEDPKDIEICAVPRWEEQPDPGDLFGESTIRVNRLHQWAISCACSVRWIKPGIADEIDWPPKSDGKYWRGVLPQGIRLDLFLADRNNFGLIYLIRTGSSQFSEAIVTQAKRLGRPCKDGWLTWDGCKILTPEEDDVWRQLGLLPVPPAERTGREALRWQPR
jgi:DNA polymerase/3'-5' exonuclease PolX